MAPLRIHLKSVTRRDACPRFPLFSPAIHSRRVLWRCGGPEAAADEAQEQRAPFQRRLDGNPPPTPRRGVARHASRAAFLPLVGAQLQAKGCLA